MAHEIYLDLSAKLKILMKKMVFHIKFPNYPLPLNNGKEQKFRKYVLKYVPLSVKCLIKFH